ncbi:MAG: alpha/beta fold hydrolase [Planktomarina sp.]
MPTTRIEFTGHDGSTLAARLDMPDGPHLATALFAHCFTCSKDIPAARRIAARLAASGIATMRFDFTGLGNSKGEFANTTFTSNVHDLVLAAQHLAHQGMAPALLIGHSLGGAAVLKAASEVPSVQAVVTLGAPFEPEHVTHNFGGALGEISDNGEATVELAGRPFIIRQSFVDDVNAAQLTPAIAKLKKALLVMHAPGDVTVGVENATQIFVAAKHPKSFVTLDDADHLITRAADAEYAAEVIAAWATRYIDMAEVKVETPPHAPEGVVRVTEADPAGFLQTITHGTKHMLSDEPKKVGGTDRGLTPYGLVSAGLGACTSMTLRMYARHKKWPLDNVVVDVTHDKVHVQAAEGKNEKVDTFTRSIHVTGDLDDDQRQRLLEIADKCPVHKTLERENHIVTQLA